MWPFSKKESFDEAEKRLVMLEEEAVKQEEAERKKREKRLADIGKLIDKMQEAVPVIDFHSMRVVSIERNHTDITIQGEKWTIPCTIVGYIDNVYGEEGHISSSSIREWTLYCNDDQHKELVDAFRKYINMRLKGEIRSY